ncbi:MAG: hypothetical protein LW816_07475 [Planctomyces sp.]|jgi:hypothetical protein|nr:hypothetical protein [Planctomyces sp.]
MKMLTFQDWLVIREGLWLNDYKAVEGLSKVPSPKTEETAPTQAAHAGREATQAAGASRAAEVFNRTNEKRTTMVVARSDCLLFLTD